MAENFADISSQEHQNRAGNQYKKRDLPIFQRLEFIAEDHAHRK